MATIKVKPVDENTILIGYSIASAKLPGGGKVALIASGAQVRAHVFDKDGRRVGNEYGYEFDITPAVEEAVAMATAPL